MEYIYIENYLKLSRLERIKFLDHLSTKKRLNIFDQEMIFSEDAILLEFIEEIDANIVYNQVLEYFNDNSFIKVDIANKIFDNVNKKLFLQKENKTINV